MKKLTENEYDLLIIEIYDSLIAQPENGLGEMGDCRDEAKRIVDTWIKKANIKLDF